MRFNSVLKDMNEIKLFLKVKSKLFGTLLMPLVGRYEVGILL